MDGTSMLNLNPKGVQIVAILALGIVFGFAIGENSVLPFGSLLYEDQQLASVSKGTPWIDETFTPENTSGQENAAESHLELEAPLLEPDSVTITDAETSAQVVAADAQLAPASPAPLRSRGELELLIHNTQISIDRMNAEISRIRDTSVALVGEFETNCGDWEDDCARYYVIALEENNRSYGELMQKIEQEEYLLAELENEISFAQ